MQNLINHTSEFLTLALCVFSASTTLCTDHSGGAGSSKRIVDAVIVAPAMQGTLQELFDKHKSDLSVADHVRLAARVQRLTTEEKELRKEIALTAEQEKISKIMLKTGMMTIEEIMAIKEQRK